MSESKTRKGAVKPGRRQIRKEAEQPSNNVSTVKFADRDPFLRCVAKAVIDFRSSHKMTQMQLATAAGIGLTSVHHIETASANTTILTLRKVAQALNEELRDLIPLESMVAEILHGASERM